MASSGGIGVHLSCSVILRQSYGDIEQRFKSTFEETLTKYNVSSENGVFGKSFSGYEKTG